jgi:hypothetical protein
MVCAECAESSYGFNCDGCGEPAAIGVTGSVGSFPVYAQSLEEDDDEESK